MVGAPIVPRPRPWPDRCSACPPCRAAIRSGPWRSDDLTGAAPTAGDDDDDRDDVAAGDEWGSELYRIAANQFDRAGALLELDPEFVTRLGQPRRALVVNFPVRMDSGEVLGLTGYRVQHTLTMGPTKGGFRYGADVSLGECAALAMWMTWKCALLGPALRRREGRRALLRRTT